MLLFFKYKGLNKGKHFKIKQKYGRYLASFHYNTNQQLCNNCTGAGDMFGPNLQHG